MLKNLARNAKSVRRLRKKLLSIGNYLPKKQKQNHGKHCVLISLVPITSNPIKSKNKDIILHAVTMIDPAIGWFEIAEIPNKVSHTVAEIVEQVWLSRYPWPTQIVLDRGSEFMQDFTRMVKEDYGIKKKTITARNPQVHSIIERVHQTIDQMIRSMEVQNTENIGDPFKGILSEGCFIVRATVHTTLQATPSQLALGRDHILNIKFQANWKNICNQKQKIIDKNNQNENKNRKEYQYVVGQKVLIKTEQSRKYGKNPYEGPFEIVALHSIGSAKLSSPLGQRAVYQTYNIRDMFPFEE